MLKSYSKARSIYNHHTSGDFSIIQDVSTCNLTGSLLLGLEVDEPLNEPSPLWSDEIQETIISMAYTRHMNTGEHYLFLGTNDGRMFQVKNYQWNDVQCVLHYNP